MTEVRDFLGNIHEIQVCNMDDIDPHFEIIKQYIEEDDYDAFKFKMEECVKAGTAFHINHEVFLYYKNSQRWLAQGAALYSKDPIKMMALFVGVFTEIDTATFTMEFHLHKQKFIEEYKSIITLTSLKRQTIEGYPLIVRIDHLKAKYAQLYKKRGVNWHVSGS
jgi:hypothetical protein